MSPWLFTAPSYVLPLANVREKLTSGNMPDVAIIDPEPSWNKYCSKNRCLFPLAAKMAASG
jgi:hypothetical protein